MSRGRLQRTNTVTMSISTTDRWSFLRWRLRILRLAKNQINMIYLFDLIQLNKYSCPHILGKNVILFQTIAQPSKVGSKSQANQFPNCLVYYNR
jgi:hypothetical protein